MKYILIIFLFIISTVKVLANNITVTCDSSGFCSQESNLPLFVDNNIYPGYISESRITVQNRSPEKCNLFLTFMNGSDWSDRLSSFISLKISSANFNLSGTLNNLTTKGEIPAGDLKPDSVSFIDVKAVLGTAADNEIQNLKTGFNIKLDFICRDEKDSTKQQILGVSTEKGAGSKNTLKFLGLTAIVILFFIILYKYL